MALLEPIELLDVVEVVAADHDGALHLRRDDHALQDSSADADVPQFARARDPSGAMHIWSQGMQDQERTSNNPSDPVKGHFLSTKFLR